MQSKMYINIWIFLLLVEVKLSKYADIQFVESETVIIISRSAPYYDASACLSNLSFIILQKHTEGLHLIFK